MNFFRNKKQRKNNISKRSGDYRRVTVIGYGLLTLAIIWSATLLSSRGITAFEVWFPAFLLTLFVLVISLMLLMPDKEYDY